MKLRKKVSLALVALLAAGSLASCSAGGAEQGAIDEFPEKWDEEITIDVFDGLANYMGIQQGWFAKIVEDKFNMKLNIIAPNVAGGGDTLYNTRVAAGDLGDLIITDKGEKLDELIEGGLVQDSSNYYGAMDNVAEFDAAVEKLNDGKDGVYGFPTSVSSLKPTEPSEGLNPTFGPYVRWDYYKEAGYPEIGTLEDLLPVLADMQAAHPTADNGQPTYAFSLFKDWDGNMMVTAKQPACFYGYDEIGFVLAKADGSDYQSILDPDSEYMRNLKLYYDANQLGLVDPESTTQNYDTLFSKFQNGQVLFSWWPWLGQSAYNTEENMAAGKGFQMVPLEGPERSSRTAPRRTAASPVFAIGSKAEDPERIAAFIDWLYSAEGAYANSSQTGASAGPQGLTWDVNDAGEPELTDFGNQVFLEGGATVPEEWGGGDYADGVSALNLSAVLPIEVDTETGLPVQLHVLADVPGSRSPTRSPRTGRARWAAPPPPWSTCRRTTRCSSPRVRATPRRPTAPRSRRSATRSRRSSSSSRGRWSSPRARRSSSRSATSSSRPRTASATSRCSSSTWTTRSRRTTRASP